MLSSWAAFSLSVKKQTNKQNVSVSGLHTQGSAAPRHSDSGLLVFLHESLGSLPAVEQVPAAERSRRHKTRRTKAASHEDKVTGVKLPGLKIINYIIQLILGLNLVCYRDIYIYIWRQLPFFIDTFGDSSHFSCHTVHVMWPRWLTVRRQHLL